MADFTGNLTGVAELVKKLGELGKMDDGKALRSAARAGVKPVFNQAKVNIPKSQDAVRTKRKGVDGKGRIVGPGFASRQMRTITQLKPSLGIARASVGVRADAFYAVDFVQRGTKKQKKQPWLTDAFESTLDAQIEAVKVALQKQIDKASK